MAAPFFFIKKADSGLRLCIDYYALNEVTVKNWYPIPRISDLIDALSKVSIFTKINLQWGYNNVWIWEGDEKKMAFCTQLGLYYVNIMYFSFANIPATFQSIINYIFKDLILKG